jgi:spore coat-associated protein N
MSILQKNKKAAAGIGVVAAAAAVLALGAGTYAAFTDTEDVDATFAAGTLDLVIGGTTGAGKIELANLVPGQVVTHTVSIDNIGTVDGVLSFNATLEESDGVCTEPEQSDGGCGADLADAITVTAPGAPGVKLSALTSGIGLSGISLPAQPGPQSFELTFAVDEGAGNEIQGDTVTADITATLEQQTS